MSLLSPFQCTIAFSLFMVAVGDSISTRDKANLQYISGGNHLTRRFRKVELGLKSSL